MVVSGSHFLYWKFAFHHFLATCLYFRWRNSPCWARALFTASSRHFSLSNAFSFHRRTPKRRKSASTSSNQRILGRPIDRLPSGFVWRTFFGTLSSGIWHLSLRALMPVTMVDFLYSCCNSAIVLLLHLPFMLMAPKILRNIFLSQVLRRFSSFFVRVHVSEVYSTTCLIIVA